MVCRDDADGRPAASRCSSPAGASPASVSAGAPSSGPQARPETAVARAGCQEPLRREQVRGPQHEVKPAASTDSQPESRAAHVTVKATSPAPRSGGVRAGGLGGVGGAARGHGEGRNTRGPSARPGSGQRGSHKPKVKAGAAQRDSEGAIVLRRAVQQNAAGGKGPCGGHGAGARTREVPRSFPEPPQVPLRIEFGCQRGHDGQALPDTDRETVTPPVTEEDLVVGPGAVRIGSKQEDLGVQVRHGGRCYILQPAPALHEDRRGSMSCLQPGQQVLKTLSPRPPDVHMDAAELGEILARIAAMGRNHAHVTLQVPRPCRRRRHLCDHMLALSDKILDKPVGDAEGGARVRVEHGG